MKKFLKHMLKPMAIISCVPSLGIVIYWITQRKDLLATSIIIYIGIVIGNVIKYSYKEKCSN